MGWGRGFPFDRKKGFWEHIPSLGGAWGGFFLFEKATVLYIVYAYLTKMGGVNKGLLIPLQPINTPFSILEQNYLINTIKPFMRKKRTYIPPRVVQINCEYEGMICHSKPITPDASNSSEEDWNPNETIGGDDEHGFE